MEKDPNGRIYYKNHKLKISSWYPPVISRNQIELENVQLENGELEIGELEGIEKNIIFTIPKFTKATKFSETEWMFLHKYSKICIDCKQREVVVFCLLLLCFAFIFCGMINKKHNIMLFKYQYNYYNTYN